MNHESSVIELSAQLALLSLMAVGGGVVLIAPEVRQFVVEARHWLSGEQFAAAYAIAQAAPGPNMLFISLIGWLMAGWTGAIAATLAVILPSTLLTLAILRMRPAGLGAGTGGRLARALGDAFAPMSIGLLAATAWLFAGASNANWHAALLTLASAFMVLRSKVSPLILIAAGALAGLLHMV